MIMFKDFSWITTDPFIKSVRFFNSEKADTTFSLCPENKDSIGFDVLCVSKNRMCFSSGKSRIIDCSINPNYRCHLLLFSAAI